MTAITRKLLREAARLWGQIATIALVLAGGVTCFIGLRGTTASLADARTAYYDRYRFADLFGTVESAPESIVDRIQAIPGVATVDTRISKEVTVPIEGMDRPAWAHLISLPELGEPKANALCLQQGRLPERGRDDEVVVLESFARAHGLAPNARIPVVMNGKLRQLRVVGVALSPEYVYAIRPGAMMNDPQRYAVLWMNRSTLASAFRLEGSFDDVTVRLQPGASSDGVRAEMDRVLAPYGNDGTIDRDHQTSNRILTSELSQLEGIAGMVPLVFLAVAAFLVNMVLGRMVALERPVIAALKAIGYTNREIARHYLGLVLVVLAPGTVVGVVGGWALGGVVVGLYGDLFRFPDLAFHMSFGLVAAAIGVSGASALVGAFLAVRRAVALPPAEAMRPPSPSRFRRSFLERMGLGKLIGPSGMMVVRDVQRHAFRTLLSSTGMSGAIALIVLGHFGVDSLDDYVERTLRRQQRQDLSITFSHPVSPRALSEVALMPGVTQVEGLRAISVRARHEQRMRDCVLMGLPPNASLRRILDRKNHAVAAPRDGVIVTRTLGEVLDLRVGERIDLEIREARRPTVHPVVVGFVDESVGLQVYALDEEIEALERDEGALSAVLVTAQPDARAVIEERLRRSPNVIDVSDIGDDIERLRATNSSMMDIWTVVSISLAACVIFGVVYNNARIALTVRSRELGSLRVLGMSRREISWILIAGLAIEMAIAIPLGLWLGRTWSVYFMSNVDRESFRWAVVVSPTTYLMAAATALLAGAASALWVRRQLDHLDLIAVLKTRE